MKNSIALVLLGSLAWWLIPHFWAWLGRPIGHRYRHHRRHRRDYE